MTTNSPRLQADTQVCIAAGMCVTSAPDVFDQDDATGLVRLLITVPSEGDLDAVRRAVACCPSGALTLTDSLLEAPTGHPDRERDTQ